MVILVVTATQCRRRPKHSPLPAQPRHPAAISNRHISLLMSPVPTTKNHLPATTTEAASSAKSNGSGCPPSLGSTLPVYCALTAAIVGSGPPTRVRMLRSNLVDGRWAVLKPSNWIPVAWYESTCPTNRKASEDRRITGWSTKTDLTYSARMPDQRMQRKKRTSSGSASSTSFWSHRQANHLSRVWQTCCSFLTYTTWGTGLSNIKMRVPREQMRLRFKKTKNRDFMSRWTANTFVINSSKWRWLFRA